MKSATSVLSLASEELIDVSAQKKLAILLSPKTIVLLSLSSIPEGEELVPARLPRNKLLLPVDRSCPASLPTNVL